MFNNCVAVLDIGSSYVSLFVGERSVNGTFSFRAKESTETYPFFSGEFIDVKEFKETVSSLYTDLKEKNDISQITSIFVSVPGEFTKVVSKNYKITFNNPKKITLSDIENLYELSFEEVNNYTLINRSACYFMLNNAKTDNPLGAISSSLAGRLSFVFVNDYFKEIVSAALYDVGIKDVKYVSSDLAENLYLFDESEKSSCRILVDVGCTTTSITIAYGNGLMYSASTALGGGVITANLLNDLGCDYHVAEKLKRKINLGLRDNPTAKYLLIDGFNEEFSFERTKVNESVFKSLDELAENIDSRLAKCSLNVPSDIQTYFTGGGICFIRGAVEYVSSRLTMLPNVIKPKIPHYDKPNQSSKISILDTVIKYKNDKIFFPN